MRDHKSTLRLLVRVVEEIFEMSLKKDDQLTVCTEANWEGAKASQRKKVESIQN